MSLVVSSIVLKVRQHPPILAGLCVSLIHSALYVDLVLAARGRLRAACTQHLQKITADMNLLLQAIAESAGPLQQQADARVGQGHLLRSVSADEA